MRLTNKYHLPQAIVNAIQADDYDKGSADFSATELAKPAQARRLEKQYDGHLDLTEDASDRLWALLGKIGHKILEDHAEEGTIIEERLFRDIEVSIPGQGVNTYTISGAMDVQRDMLGHWKINDWKFTSVGTVMYGEYPKPEWVSQLNVYQWLRQEPTELQITAIFRDFKKSQIGKKWRGAARPHPDIPVKMIPIPSWPMADTERWIAERIRAHMAEPVADCTTEERWGGTRCKDWCAASVFCPQYQVESL